MSIKSISLFLLLNGVAIFSCSQKQSFSEQKIVGGEEIPADHSIAKSTVALVNSLNLKSFCSGVVIARRVVLTAAHCILQTTPDSVVSFGNISEETPTIKIGHSVTHPDFDESQLEIEEPLSIPADIGLIFLESDAPVSFAPNTLPTNDKQISGNDALVLAGYGASEVRPNKGLGVLRAVTTSVSKIDSVNHELRYGGQRGKTACVGDSGGPAFTTSKSKTSRLELVGIISRGETLCTEIGFVTDLRDYGHWIITESSIQH
ncbi:MAG: trypsin-like serine protease [Proteobacteria bacterium]|nr:trypsin-like serine protease [Pseudomonadota bacterium]